MPISCYVIENELHLLSSTAMYLKVKCVLYLVCFLDYFLKHFYQATVKVYQHRYRSAETKRNILLIEVY